MFIIHNNKNLNYLLNFFPNCKKEYMSILKTIIITMFICTMIFACNKTTSVTEEKIIEKIILSEQDEITNQILKYVLTYQKHQLFTSATREGEEAKDIFYKNKNDMEKNLIGKKINDWECNIAKGEFNSSPLPIDLLKNGPEYISSVHCFAHYIPKDKSNNGNSYHLEHYKVYPNSNSNLKIKKLYAGDTIKINGVVKSISLVLINQFELVIDDADITLVK